MANLFNNLFKGLFGQQDIPNLQGYNGQSIFQNLLGNQDALAKGNVDYYAKTGIPGAGVTRQIENIYDPNAGNLREATTSKILNDLNLGNKLPADVTRQVMQNSHENAQGAGIGFSPAARSLSARDLGLTSLDVGNQRLNRAQSYTGQEAGQFGNFLGQTMGNTNNFFTPAQFAQTDINGINQGNSINNEISGIQGQNNLNMSDTLLNILGKTLGASAGGGFQDILSKIFGTAPSSIPASPAIYN